MVFNGSTRPSPSALSIGPPAWRLRSVCCACSRILRSACFVAQAAGCCPCGRVIVHSGCLCQRDDHQPFSNHLFLWAARFLLYGHFATRRHRSTLLHAPADKGRPAVAHRRLWICRRKLYIGCHPLHASGASLAGMTERIHMGKHWCSLKSPASRGSLPVCLAANRRATAAS